MVALSKTPTSSVALWNLLGPLGADMLLIVNPVSVIDVTGVMNKRLVMTQRQLDLVLGYLSWRIMSKRL